MTAPRIIFFALILAASPVAADSMIIWERINQNVVERVERFAAAPGHKTIELNSMGGDVFAARRIARIIRRHKIDTAVHKNAFCYSMCVLIFAAGHNRTAHETAMFGLHRIYDRRTDAVLGEPADTDNFRHMELYGLRRAKPLLRRVLSLRRPEWLVLSAHELSGHLSLKIRPER